jgi:lysozyme
MMIGRRTGGLAVAAVLLSALGVVGCSAAGESGNECPTAGSSSDALKVCSTGTTLKGVDVSKYQGSIAWGQVKSAGNVFAIARVSDGLNYPDSYFTTNWNGIKTAGLVRGVYQFFRPGQDPVAQANLLLTKVNALGGLKAGDLAPVLDLETTDGVAASTIVARAKTWLTKIEQATGRRPIVYTAAFMSSVLGSNFGAYPLWVANYETTCPTMPTGWSNWKMWQYSSTGSVAGISGNVDVNKFQGTLTELLAFAGGGSTQGGTGGDAGAGSDDGGAGSGGSAAETYGGTVDGQSHGGDEGAVMGDGFNNARVVLDPNVGGGCQ